MSLKTFLNFTRIQTLPAALMSPLAGLLFSIWYFDCFHWLSSLLFFIGLVAINLFVSAWNNLMDYKKATDETYRSQQNIIGLKKIPLGLAWRICLIFLAIDLVIGIWVTWITNLAILPVGGLAFLIAIFYTYGPFAFSRFPLGELLAGLCEGAIGFFMGVYMNSFDRGYFYISWQSGFVMNWRWDFTLLIPIVLISIGCFMQNFNVMLSDNISDLDQDVRNQRFTLPWYIKLPWSLRLYKIAYLLSGLIIVLAIVFHILPIWSLLMVGVLPLILSNMRRFLAKQVKSETFILQVRNLMLFDGALALTLWIGILFK